MFFYIFLDGLDISVSILGVYFFGVSNMIRLVISDECYCFINVFFFVYQYIFLSCNVVSAKLTTNVDYTVGNGTACFSRLLLEKSRTWRLSLRICNIHSPIEILKQLYFVNFIGYIILGVKVFVEL